MARGQITVFMIVGILLLAIFAAILFITNSTITDKAGTEAAPVIDTVPQEFNAIQTYTTNCLKSVAENALVIAGQQGGHIAPTMLGDFSPSNPTDSAGINLNSLLVPYWHYNSQPNGLPQVSIINNRPELKGDDFLSMESQLGRYVDQEIERCLSEYQTFVGQGFLVEYDEKKTQVKIFDGYVDFILDMPLKIDRGKDDAFMETFYVRVDVDLKHMYEVAQNIVDFEINTTFIESHFLNVLRVHMGTAPDRFPPVLLVQFDENPSEFWLTQDLRGKLKSLLNSYIPILRFSGSDNFYRHEYDSMVSDFSSLYQQASDDMILDLGENAGVDVNFNYFDWEPYLNVNGGQEELRPTSLFMEAPFDLFRYELGFEKFVNTYDVSFPVLVTLYDADSFQGKGYTLNFAMEANVINNKPIDASYVQPETVRAGNPSLICDREQRDTEMIKTLVVDASTQEPLEMVNFGYSIPDQDYCVLGQSDNDGVHKENYPAAYGGVLDLKLDGYLSEYFSFDSYPYKTEPGIVGYAIAGINEPAIELYPMKEIKLSVKKKNVEKCVVMADVPQCVKSTSGPKKFQECVEDSPARACFFNSGNGLFLPPEPDIEILANGSSSRWQQYYFIDNSYDLATIEENGADEGVIGILERMSDIYGEMPGHYSEQLTVTFDINGKEEAIVELVPGLYKVTMNTRMNFPIDNPYVIATDERCFTTKKNSCSNITGQTMDQTITGFVNWNSTETYLLVTPEDLYSSDYLEMYVLTSNVLEIPTQFEAAGNKETRIYNGKMIEDLVAMTDLNKLSRSTKVRSALEPQWLTIQGNENDAIGGEE
jgi:hypothetical protein